jgi:hypothetical protein
MASNITCLVTLHGIGFEQPPNPTMVNSGYADLFHQHLSTYLKSRLSDDPYRDRRQRGENGAIYVQSRYRNKETQVASREEGLKRLGTWDDDQHMNTTDALLVPENAVDGSIAHVALVYSNLEPMRPEVGAALMTSAMSLFASPHYASASGLLHMALTDGLAMIGHRAANDQRPISSRPRTDLGPRSTKRLGQQSQAAPAPSPSLLAALRFVEEDVACYVCHNEERERVRSFVAEALLRLATRDDVRAIVFNTHSNGTVIAFDVLRHLPAEVMSKIKAFVTAGSPLRKYVDLFQWGNQIEYLYPIDPWYNFWDPRDPVADPLDPPISWHVGDRILPSQEKLFSRIDLDSEMPCWIPVEDLPVDNVNNSFGGGLRAHNYWDNEVEFAKPLADIVRGVADHSLARAAVTHVFS